MTKPTIQVRLVTLASSLLVLLCVAILPARGQSDASVEKPIDLWSIRKKLVFRTRKTQTIDELNRGLIAEVRRRSVSFLLTDEDAAALAKAGASQLLIEAIVQSEPQGLRVRSKEIDEANALYMRFAENFNKKNVINLRIALDSGKEFLKRFDGYPELKEQAAFVRTQIVRVERWLESITPHDAVQKP